MSALWIQARGNSSREHHHLETCATIVLILYILITHTDYLSMSLEVMYTRQCVTEVLHALCANRVSYHPGTIS